MLDYSKISSTFSIDNIFIIPIDGQEIEKENSQNEKESDRNITNNTVLKSTPQNILNYNNKSDNINNDNNSNFNVLTSNNININLSDKNKNNPFYFNQSMYRNQDKDNNIDNYKYENNNTINKNIIYEDDSQNNNELSILNLKNSNNTIYNHFTSEYLESNWKNNVQFQLYKLKTELTQKVLLKMNRYANYGNEN